MSSRRLVLIDGNSLLHRAYHALPPLRTREGKEVGAVFGFTSMLLKVLSDLSPDYVAVTFDTPALTFRYKEYPQYKAHRPETDKSCLPKGSKILLRPDIPTSGGIRWVIPTQDSLSG